MPIYSDIVRAPRRMHPLLAAFPSASFYGGRLLSHPRPEERLPAPGFPWPNPAAPVAFVEVPGPSELRSQDGTSISNPPEAALAAHVARLFASRMGADGAEAVGVISPYAGQVRVLSDAVTALFGEAKARDLEVKTVDGFQGREKEVIVFSSVRSNSRREARERTDTRAPSGIYHKIGRSHFWHQAAATVQRWLTLAKSITAHCRADNPLGVHFYPGGFSYGPPPPERGHHPRKARAGGPWQRGDALVGPDVGAVARVGVEERLRGRGEGERGAAGGGEARRGGGGGAGAGGRRGRGGEGVRRLGARGRGEEALRRGAPPGGDE